MPERRTKPYEPTTTRSARPASSGRTRATCGARRARRVYEVDARNKPVRGDRRAHRPGARRRRLPHHRHQRAVPAPRRRWPPSCAGPGATPEPVGYPPAPAGATVVDRPDQRPGPGHGLVPHLRPARVRRRHQPARPTTQLTDPEQRASRFTEPGHRRACTPPGSTFKLVTAYAGLRTGVITPDFGWTTAAATRSRAAPARAGCTFQNAGGAGLGTVEPHAAITRVERRVLLPDRRRALAATRGAVGQTPDPGRRPASSGSASGPGSTSRRVAGSIPTPARPQAKLLRGRTRKAVPRLRRLVRRRQRSTSPSARPRCWSRRCSSPTPTPPSPTAAPSTSPPLAAQGDRRRSPPTTVAVKRPAEGDAARSTCRPTSGDADAGRLRRA